MFNAADLATVVSAVGGLLSGVAGLITALRQTERDTDTPTPRAPTTGRTRRATPSPEAAPETTDADEDWTGARYGGLALLMALVLVALVRSSDLALDGQALAMLRYGIAVPFALALYFAVRTLYDAVVRRSRGLLISAGTGLIAAVGALAAMLIVSTPGPT